MIKKPKGHKEACGRVIFDIETAPDPNRVEELMKPFDPDSVKIGNIKDELKIAEKIEAAREAHIKSAHDKAALHAETAQVCAIGVKGVGLCKSYHYLMDADASGEAECLEHFWKIASSTLNAQRELVGFHIKAFDFPFLVRRSFHLGVDVSSFLFNVTNRRWHTCVLDLMEVYAAGEWGFRISLDRLSRSLGLGSKSEQEVTGKYFHKYWRGNAEEKKLARNYLRTDLDLSDAVAHKLLGEPNSGGRMTDEEFADLFDQDKGGK